VIKRELAGAAAEQYQQHRRPLNVAGHACGDQWVFRGHPSLWISKRDDLKVRRSGREVTGRLQKFIVPITARLVYVRDEIRRRQYVPGAARTPIVVDAGRFIGQRGACRD
jgi:hypothetical protein